MKQLPTAVVLPLVVFALLMSACPTANAALGDLDIDQTSGSRPLSSNWLNTVTMTGYSYWSAIEPHTNNLTTEDAITWPLLSVGPYFGPGTYYSSFDVVLNEAGEWECWVVDKGVTTWPIPYTPWAVSTNHVSVFVS